MGASMVKRTKKHALVHLNHMLLQFIKIFQDQSVTVKHQKVGPIFV